MGRLIDGKWVKNDELVDSKGRFVRKESHFRNMVTASGESGFKAEAGRYRLIVSFACGWSHRTLLVRALKGLEEAVPLTNADAYMGENGWSLKEQSLTATDLFLEENKEGRESLQDKKIDSLPDLYVLADSTYTGRVSVPVLWDMKKGTIVSNESSEIIKMFNSEFEEFCKNKIQLNPSGLEEKIQEMIQANYSPVNNGVYRCGFASSQEAYTEAAVGLFDRLDELESILGQQRYLVSGDSLTMADVCLFPTIFRFDDVYHTHFKCNKKYIYVDYPNIFGWARELYQMGGVKGTCSVEQNRVHYYTSHESIHPRRYIPLCPEINWDEPHGRGEKF